LTGSVLTARFIYYLVYLCCAPPICNPGRKGYNSIRRAHILLTPTLLRSSTLSFASKKEGKTAFFTLFTACGREGDPSASWRSRSGESSMRQLDYTPAKVAKVLKRISTINSLIELNIFDQNSKLIALLQK
jgi:hypothetical protein